jgi:hypothetical protein
LEPIAYETEAGRETPEPDPTRDRPPWVVTIVALVVAVVSVTLLVTDDDPEPTPVGTVEMTVHCEIGPNGEGGAACGRKAAEVVNDSCADPTIEAVAVSFFVTGLGPGPDGGPHGTVVCDDLTPIVGAFFGDPEGSPPEP